MRKKYYNYLIILSLIFLISVSFVKKNNYIVFTISPIKSHDVNKTKYINANINKYFLFAYLLHIKKNFSNFYIDDYTYNEINKIYPNINIINYKKYYILIIKDYKKKIKNIDKIKTLLENHLYNQNVYESFKIYEKLLDNNDRMYYKYFNKEDYKELAKYR